MECSGLKHVRGLPYKTIITYTKQNKLWTSLILGSSNDIKVDIAISHSIFSNMTLGNNKAIDRHKLTNKLIMFIGARSISLEKEWEREDICL